MSHSTHGALGLRSGILGLVARAAGPPVTKERIMSTHSRLVAEYYTAFNRRDADIYARLFTNDCQLLAPGIQVSRIEALRAFDQAWSFAFSEARVESLRMSETDGAV